MVYLGYKIILLVIYLGYKNILLLIYLEYKDILLMVYLGYKIILLLVYLGYQDMLIGLVNVRPWEEKRRRTLNSFTANSSSTSLHYSRPETSFTKHIHNVTIKLIWCMFFLTTVRTRKLWNRKTTLAILKCIRCCFKVNSFTSLSY